MNSNILDINNLDSKCTCGYDIDLTLSSLLPQCRTCWLFDEKTKKTLNKSKPDDIKPEIDEIIPGVFISNQQASKDLELLISKEITDILICGGVTSGLTQSYPDKFKYKQIDIEDFPHIDITDKFEECIKFIQERDKNILVHCSFGMSRSVSFVIAYLIKIKAMSFNSAYKLIKSKRGVAYPNKGFVKQLRKLEEKI